MSASQKKCTKDSNAIWKDMVFLAVILGSLFFTLLGNRPLFVPDEGRYAEIAREMATSNDFITPHLNGVIYFEKPALFYWLGAIAFKVGGVNLWSIRCINALLGLLGCIGTYATARTLYGRRTGLLAAFILGTSLLYFVMTRMISLDLPVTVFIALSLYAFILGMQQPVGGKRRLFFYWATLSAALAVLTKGLIGIVFPLLTISAWLSLTQQWRIIRTFYLPSCLFLFLLITLPWHTLLQLRHPEFFHFYFVEQHVLRYTYPAIGHNEPWWFFTPYLIGGFFPWIIFLPKAIRQTIQNKSTHHQMHASLFFLLWAAIIFIFFSFSKSKLIPYILPLFPPLAILTAQAIATCSATFIRYLLVTTWSVLLGLTVVMPHLDTRTIQPLAALIKPQLNPNDEVITYHQYYQDLPFYLERRVSILNWQNELQFGMQHQDTHEWMIDDRAFLERWQSKRRVFVIMSQQEFGELQKKHPEITPMTVIGQTNSNILLSNTPS